MKYLFNTRLGDTRFRLSDGSLLCKDVPIARTGSQLYSADDLPNLEADSDGEIVVERTPDEVFSPETLASFEGMTVTILHPEDDAGNIKFVDPDNWRELAVGHVQNVRRGTGSQSDLTIADLIIKDEAAIGYIESGLREVSCGYDAEYKQTGAGKAKQHQITGNHVALVPNGRAGSRCAIGDNNTMATNKNWFTRLRRAVKTGDNDTMNELLESAPSNVTGDDGGDLPQGVNLNINLSPQNPMPDKNPEMGGQPTGDDNAEVPAWAQALIARLDALEGKTTDSDNPDDKDKTGDSDEDDEEETTATGDSAYRAELILPGINLKQAMKPTAFKRHVLATADQSLVRQIVGDAAIKTLNKSVVDMAFTAVSELAKSRNTAAQRTADAAQRTTNSISSLNQRNQEFWAKR